MSKLKVTHKAETPIQKHPNEGVVTAKEVREAAEENYWQGRELGELRKKYIQFNVLMELVQEVLELPVGSTFDQLGRRSFHLVTINLDDNESK